MTDKETIRLLSYLLIFLTTIAIIFGTRKEVTESPVTEDTGAVDAPLLLDANVSAYCPCEKCCGRWANGVTASGHVIHSGDKFMAAPSNYPFGTVIDIPGYGAAPVLDRGGAITGNKLDVFFPTHQEALEWGRQYLTVEVWK